MPLSKIHTDILRLLASHRDPESDVAGSTPLNREAPRIPATSTFSMIARNQWRELRKKMLWSFRSVVTACNGSGPQCPGPQRAAIGEGAALAFFHQADDALRQDCAVIGLNAAGQHRTTMRAGEYNRSHANFAFAASGVRDVGATAGRAGSDAAGAGADRAID